MAAYESTKITTKAPPRAGLGITAVGATFTFPSAPALNDTVKMFTLPKGARVHEMVFASDDLDTGGTPTISMQVGTGATADKFIVASSIGRTGGLTRLDQKDALLEELSADTDVIVRVSAGPATGATGTIRLSCIYSLEL